MKKRQPKCQTLESTKLTKKQLQTEYFHGNLDTTIEGLTLDQLRVALYREKKAADHYGQALNRVIHEAEKAF